MISTQRSEIADRSELQKILSRYDLDSQKAMQPGEPEIHK